MEEGDQAYVEDWLELGEGEQGEPGLLSSSRLARICLLDRTDSDLLSTEADLQNVVKLIGQEKRQQIIISQRVDLMIYATYKPVII